MMHARFLERTAPSCAVADELFYGLRIAIPLSLGAWAAIWSAVCWARRGRTRREGIRITTT